MKNIRLLIYICVFLVGSIVFSVTAEEEGQSYLSQFLSNAELNGFYEIQELWRTA